MSGSIRRGKPAPLETFFCLLAVLLFAGILTALAYQSGLRAANDERAADQRYDKAKEDSQRACAGLQSLALGECIAKAVEAAQEQSDSRQDLYAQRRMVGLTFWSVLLSALSVALTGVGIWFVKRTLDATLEAVEDTGRATKAVMEANKIAREIGQAQARAYLSVPKFSVQIIQQQTGHIVPTASFELANSGQTPATFVHFAMEVEMINVQGPIGITLDKPIRKPDSPFPDVAANSIPSTPHFYPCGEPINPVVFQKPFAIMAHVRVSYIDVFGNKHGFLVHGMIAKPPMFKNNMWMIPADVLEMPLYGSWNEGQEVEYDPDHYKK